MKGPIPEPERRITIRDLYPELNEEELREVEENLERYIKLTLRIYGRIRSDPEAYAKFKVLTASKTDPRIEIPRSNPTDN